MAKDVEITSITDSDLTPILKHFNLEESLESGQLECTSCSRTMTWENIGILKVDNGNLILYCDFTECIEEAR